MLWLLEDVRTQATLPAASLSLLVSLSICLLSYIEHVRCVRPSTIIALYCFFSLIFDGFQARTLFLLGTSAPLFWNFAAAVFVKLILLILESRSKAAYLKEPYKNLSVEELGGVFNVSFLWWINPLIFKGYKTLLSPDDLPKIDTQLSTQICRNDFQKAWDERCVFNINRNWFHTDHLTAKPESRFSLPFAAVKAYKWTILRGVPFRLVIIVLTFCQPFIISRAIGFVSEPATEASKNVGVELIGAASTCLGLFTSFFIRPPFKMIYYPLSNHE